MTELAPPPRRLRAFKDFTLDLDRGQLSRGGEEIKLRPKVFEALTYLVENHNRLVPKDELIKALWTDSFVTDDSLVQCLVELRRALGDEGPACIKTVPRRGYMFTAEVRDVPAPGASAHAASAATVTTRTPPPRARRRVVALASLAVAAATVSYVVQSRPPARTQAFTDKDSVLVADFLNTTGDEVFDGTLRQAVAVQLGQSPYLNVFSEDRVRETLRYMERAPGERVTRELGREIAQRRGVKAVLAGSIASLGRHYVIGLEAVSAATGETLAREQVEAESRERVLGRLGEATRRLRASLGESLASLESHAAPIEQATTSSLDAFKAYDLGRQKHFGGQYFEAIPLYRRAVELDPDFAIAYAALGITYNVAQEPDLAAESSQRAFALRDRVSERERFYISLRYYMDVLGDGDKAIETLELWKQTYPRDFVPRTNLAARYSAIGRHEEAVAEGREGVRLNPEAGVAYAALAQSAIYLGQYQDARAVIEQASARKLGPPYHRYMLYTLAVLDGDAAAMRQQVESVTGTPAEAGMFALQSVTAAYEGRTRAARGLTQQAVDLALQRGSKQAAAEYSAGKALWEAAYGDCGRAKNTVTRTLAIARGRRALSWSALALGLCGQSADAQRLLGEMTSRFPQDSFMRTSWSPMTEAAIAIHERRPTQAIDRLQAARRDEMGDQAALWPAYLRGLAYLDQGAPAEAEAEFQKILDHRGVLAPTVSYP
ncbi:MAG TPA: winged helix-turn-helix domain-containing protein, partial [Vicinamibacteria bacterium]|nr:winged helix-turn-helix domain-containing protein [Vicinamibacteria bacterium]